MDPPRRTRLRRRPGRMPNGIAAIGGPDPLVVYETTTLPDPPVAPPAPDSSHKKRKQSEQEGVNNNLSTQEGKQTLHMNAYNSGALVAATPNCAALALRSALLPLAARRCGSGSHPLGVCATAADLTRSDCSGLDPLGRQRT